MAGYRPETRQIVVAIDFGTTFSGYTFSFKDKPLDVKTNQVWIAGTEKLMSLKTPTCVLLDPQKKFVAFGFEAENKYADLAEDNQHKNWFLFRRFKMVLYQNKDISTTTEVEDIRGKRADALTIFSHSIGYMVKHFRKTLNDQMVGVQDSDIQYVLTVPAIWNDKAKQFMRKAATKAGIPGSQLIVALEPEAASIWGQVVTDDTNSKLSEIGCQYMVADLGGGTADITAHSKMEDGTLKELHRASGGPWGGTMVDQQYLAFLERIFGPDIMKMFVERQTADFIDLLREFETKKRTVTPESDGKMAFRIPASLREICETEKKCSLKEVVERSHSSSISLAGEKLRVEMDVVKRFFKPAIDGLVAHMSKLLRKQELRNVKLILLVGGFGECPLVKDALVNGLPNIKLIVPPEASLTVLKGAVRFGHMRDIICCRKSKYAYGLCRIQIFDETIHPLEKKVITYGEERCKDLFTKLVGVGEELFLGKGVLVYGSAIHGDQTNVCVGVYCSDSNETRFVTDPGCYYLGKIKVQFPDSDKIKDKDYTVRLLFWDTEIKMLLNIVKTGEEYETVVDCI